MGAVPKKKLSKQRTSTRRNRIVASLPNLVKCENCGKPKLAHSVCSSCGYWRKMPVIAAKDNP